MQDGVRHEGMGKVSVKTPSLGTDSRRMETCRGGTKGRSIRDRGGLAVLDSLTLSSLRFKT